MNKVNEKNLFFLVLKLLLDPNLDTREANMYNLIIMVRFSMYYDKSNLRLALVELDHLYKDFTVVDTGA